MTASTWRCAPYACSGGRGSVAVWAMEAFFEDLSNYGSYVAFDSFSSIRLVVRFVCPYFLELGPLTASGYGRTFAGYRIAVDSALRAEAEAIGFANGVLRFMHDEVLSDGIGDVKVMLFVDLQVFGCVALRHFLAGGDVDDGKEFLVE